MKKTLLSLFLSGLAWSCSARTLGSLEFEPCTLAPEFVPVTVEAWCATLAVSENRAQPEGREIDLAIAWIAPDAEARPDPVFLLAGGPGQSARDSYPVVAGAFADIAKAHNILLLDQRGTGASHPLTCRDDSDAVMESVLDSTPEQAKASAARCLKNLAGNSDPAYYTTTEAVRDLEAVRAAIGAASINLIGVSYGTRVAQQYAKRYPARTRTLVLDGVVPNTLVLGSEEARNLEDALTLSFRQCGDVPACAQRFGDPRGKLDQLLSELRTAPRTVRYRDPVTGEFTAAELQYDHVAAVVRLYAYAPMVAAMLPLSLAEAAEGRADTLYAQAQMMIADLDRQITQGMQLSVTCTEDAPQLQINPADANTLLGTELAEYSLAQCSVWPKGEKPAGFNRPLASDIPALLMSGEYDPVTPPRYGAAVAEHLPNARHLVLKGQGHNVMGAGCMPKLMARFIDTADAKKLDAKCLDSLPVPPPFAGFYGWEP